MIQKVNLSSSANTISELFQYLNVGQLNNHMLNIITAEDRILDFHVHEKSDESNSTIFVLAIELAKYTSTEFP